MYTRDSPSCVKVTSLNVVPSSVNTSCFACSPSFVENQIDWLPLRCRMKASASPVGWYATSRYEAAGRSRNVVVLSLARKNFWGCRAFARANTIAIPTG